MARILLWSLALALGACGEPVPTPEPIFLQAAGSTSMAPLVADLAAAFAERVPTVGIDVVGLGTGFGLRALREGGADLALVSWLPADLEDDWQATAIARDGVAIIVHPDNPVAGLGLLQLRDLFGGRIYEWEAVGGGSTQGPVQVVSREEGSGTRAAFEAMVMEDLGVTPMAVVVPSTQAVAAYVATQPNAIGYLSMGSVSPGTKVLQIEGVLPTPETTRQGSYPLTRELWLVTADPPARAVQEFLRFVLSPAGQQIVGKYYGRFR